VKPVAVFGSLNIDLVSQMERFPQPGETLRAHTFATFSGGKGANQAVACGRLGTPVAMFGAVGGDGFGADLLHSLQTSHVQTDHVRRCEEVPSGVASIWVDGHGKNSIAITAGANGCVDRQYLDSVLPQLERVDWLLLQLEIPLETINALLEQLPTRRPQVVLDPAPAHELDALRTSRLALVTPNETELGTLTHLPVSNEKAIQRACRSLLEQTQAQAVVCKAGARGAYLDDGHGFYRFPGYAVRSVDSTAAGDAFNGALVSALASGESIERAINFANAAGALCVTKQGAQRSIPWRQDVESFIQAHPLTGAP